MPAEFEEENYFDEPEEGKNDGLFEDAEEGGFTKPRDVREKEQEVIK